MKKGRTKMSAFLLAYLATLTCFLVLDFAWLTLASPVLYKPMLGELLAPEPSLPVAAVFYAFYVVGIVVFVVMPAANAQSWVMALGLGALLGLVAYGTYDITNLATLRSWPLAVSVIDLAWGTLLSATSALSGYIALRAFTAT